MEVMVNDELKRAIKQLHLIERQLLDGNVQSFEVRQPLQDILEHKNLDRSDDDLCECGHTRARHIKNGLCTESVLERIRPGTPTGGIEGHPCRCTSFRLATLAQDRVS